MNRKYQEIIDKMKLEEKCAMLSGETAFETREFKRYKIPAMLLSDGPHGLRKQAEGANHLGIGGSVPATCFPTAQAVANSWNKALGEQVGRALGEEALAQEIGVILGPGLNIKRSHTCGRNFEYFSEDPYLAGKMAAAYVKGIQSKGVSACPKHFAVNSQELKRMASDSIVDERTMRELYLTGFEIAVKDSKPGTVMSAYNLINGVYANESEQLLKDILRNGWGFEGMVVTDWGGSNDHALGVKAGSTLEMPAPGLQSVRELIKAVNDGKISESDVDDRLDELLRVVFSTRESIDKSERSFDEKAHHELARKIAGECAVLMKNDGNILPLKAGTRVALIGDFAETPRYQGAGSSLVNATELDSALSLIKETNLEMTGFAKGFNRNGAGSESLSKEALELANSSDVVLFYMGLDEMKESEGLDRTDMKVNADQLELLRKIKESGVKVVAVLHGGSPVEMQWSDDCDAIVYAALTGQGGAAAILDVISGKVNPSGKLSETWPVSYADSPVYGRYPAKGRNALYIEGLYVGYRYYNTAKINVKYPFGYGLSYTGFEYKDIRVSNEGVSFKLSNIGEVDGSEVSQLYVGFKDRDRADINTYRPENELKGFEKTFLRAGETKEVFIPFDEYTFRRFDVKKNKFVVDGGNWIIGIAANSRDIRLSAEYEISGEKIELDGTAEKAKPYIEADIRGIKEDNFRALLGRDIPEDRVKIDRSITLGELGHGRAPIGWLIAAVLSRLLKSSEKKGSPDLNLLFQYNMPLRALAKMTEGAVSMGMVDALVMEFKGFWFIGIIRLIFEAVKNVVLNASLKSKLSD